MTANVLSEARTILRTVREDATPGPWESHDVGDEGWEWSKIVASSVTVSDHGTQRAAGIASVIASPADATLIVLLAGNPDLLDALDHLLWHYEITRPPGNVTLSITGVLIERIASAIVNGWKAIQG